MASLAEAPSQRWTALSMHAEVHVLLLVDPLEMLPPRRVLPFRGGDDRVQLDLASPAQRKRWEAEFVAPAEAAIAQLRARGVRARLLPGNAPSDAWVGALAPAGRAA